jgi:Spy/CpxP family protein refolding chaperone
MRKVMLALITVITTAAIATGAFAFGHGRGPGYGPCERGDFKGPASLNLTAEQVEKIRGLREAQWKEMKQLQEQTFAKRDEIRRLWLEHVLDEAKIAAAQKEMRSLRDQIEDKTTAFHLKAAQLLTPEQREKMGFMGRVPGHRRGAGSMIGFGPVAPCDEGCVGRPVYYNR